MNSKACRNILPLFWRKHRCHVIYNSIPENRLITTKSAAEVREALKIPADTFVLGCVSNNNPKKGFDILLKAYALLRKDLPQSCLVLVGADKELWQDLCHGLGIEEDVRIVGRPEHVADYLQIFDLYVFGSSFIESQPNVLIEAMSFDLPIIASAVGEVQEMIPDKFLFSVNDLDALCEKILEMHGSPAMLQASSGNSVGMKHLFSTEARVQSVLRVYESLIDEKSKPKKRFNFKSRSLFSSALFK